MNRLVAVSAPRRTDERERVALSVNYVQALARAGLVPLIVPPILEPAAAVSALDAVRGLVLTGGEDVAPERYGAAPHPNLETPDPARDAVELALIHGARQRRLPILAICRGLQILNVALGGTLYQDLPTERSEGTPVPHEGSTRHHLRVEAGSLLHTTLGCTSTTVNSRHHQAARTVAPGLRASAWADDGVIEALEPVAAADPWILAVQWHPEDLEEAALFTGFAAVVR